MNSPTSSPSSQSSSPPDSPEFKPSQPLPSSSSTSTAPSGSGFVQLAFGGGDRKRRGPAHRGSPPPPTTKSRNRRGVEQNDRHERNESGVGRRAERERPDEKLVDVELMSRLNRVLGDPCDESWNRGGR